MEKPTVFEGEAVYDGHPVEPVVVAGFPNREDTGAITQQCTLQPVGNLPYTTNKQRKIQNM